MKIHPEIAYTYCKYQQILFLAQIVPKRKYINAAFINLIINETRIFSLEWHVKLINGHPFFIDEAINCHMYYCTQHAWVVLKIVSKQ